LEGVERGLVVLHCLLNSPMLEDFDTGRLPIVKGMSVMVLVPSRIGARERFRKQSFSNFLLRKLVR